jgi:hypothetical protein
MGGGFYAIKLFHIIEIIQHPTFEDLFIYKPKNDQCYYVDMGEITLRVGHFCSKKVMYNKYYSMQ